MKKVFTFKAFLFATAFLAMAKANAQDAAAFFSDASVYIVPETIIFIPTPTVTASDVVYISKNTVVQGDELFENVIILHQKDLVQTKAKNQKPITLPKSKVENQKVETLVWEVFPFGKQSDSKTITRCIGSSGFSFNFYKTPVFYTSSCVSIISQETIHVLIKSGIFHKVKNTISINSLFARPPTFS